MGPRYLFNWTQGSFRKQVEISYQYRVRVKGKALVGNMKKEMKLPLEQSGVFSVN